jgi:gas vesicle protein
MKNIGYIFLAAGFLAGAYATALDVQNVNWVLFTGAAVIAVAGLVIAKTQASAHARSDKVLEVNRGELRESLQNIVTDLGDIVNDSSTRGAELRDRIDLKLRDDLRRFADARGSMVHLFGLQTYADIMSSFAAGERYINRVWSASADGYEGEAATYLEKAAHQFADAQRQLQEAAQGTS